MSLKLMSDHKNRSPQTNGLKASALTFARGPQEVVSILLLLVPNIIMWIAFFPGYFQADHQQAIAWLAIGEPNQWHSLLWGYLSYPFFLLSPHYATYGLVQIGLFALCAFFAIKRLVRLGFLKSMLPLSVFFGLFPTFLLYNELYCSDLCFSYLLIPLTTMVVEVVETKGQVLCKVPFCIRAAILCFAVLCLRKNALLIGIALCIVIPLRFRDVWKRALLTFGGALAVALILDAAMPVLVGATPSPSQEMLSVPSLQIAAVYAYDGDIPEEANEFFTRIRSEEAWSDSYESSIADFAKWRVSLSPEFVRYWMELGIRNPTIYLLAYTNLEYPFWTLVNTDDNFAKTDFSCNETFTTLVEGLDNEAYLAQFDGEEGKSSLWKKPMNLQNVVTNLQIPILTDVYYLVLCNRGLPFWVVLVGLIASRKGRRGDFLTVAIPILGVLISLLLFAPMPMLRYAMQMYYCLPVLIVYFCRRAARWNESAAVHDTCLNPSLDG